MFLGVIILESEIFINKFICFIVLSLTFLVMFIISSLRYYMNKHKIRKMKRIRR
jgi:hypothetical protein